MPTLFVTLVGGPPWGFRIQGGRGTGLPLRLSKVNPDSKSAQQGLKEGDVLRMINGHLAEGLNQGEVRDFIREAGPSLTLEIDREPISPRKDETIFTTTKTFVLNKPVQASVISTNRDEGSQSPNPRQLQNLNDLRNGHVRSTPSPSRSSESYINGDLEQRFSGTTVITDEPPPPGAVLVDQKVTIEGDKVHTDKYYALPMKEVLKEKKFTTKFIPAPSKYEGIGPTEEGIPLSLRQSVKKENMSDWYKTMFKTLHKVDNEDDTYVIGYTSDPEIRRDGRKSPKKLDLLDNSVKSPPSPDSSQISLKVITPPAKSVVHPYKVVPRSIEDYEPGFSSVADKEINTGAKRFHIIQPKHSYEIGDGYDSETHVKKTNQPNLVNPEKQKIWYRQVQHGGDIPQYGLGIPPPEKPQEPIVGPPPLPSSNYQSFTYQQATRPETLPAEYSNYSNGISQQANGIYETQMRNAIHNELRQQRFQVSPVPNYKLESTIDIPVAKKVRARTVYNFVAESPRELPLKKGDIVFVYRELDRNWYEGEHNGGVGIFPVNYVEILPPEHVAQETNRIQEGLGRILYDFRAHTSVELPVKKGDEVHLMRKVDENWYEARLGNRKGIIPASYIEIVQEPGDCNRNTPQMLLRVASPRNNQLSQMVYSPVSSPALSPQSNGYTNRSKKGSHLIEPVLYRALYKYKPQNADELELVEGDDVYIVEVCDDGWYVGTSVRTGDVGIIPGNYMERVM